MQKESVKPKWFSTIVNFCRVSTSYYSICLLTSSTPGSDHIRHPGRRGDAGNLSGVAGGLVLLLLGLLLDLAHDVAEALGALHLRGALAWGVGGLVVLLLVLLGGVGTVGMVVPGAGKE